MGDLYGVVRELERPRIQKTGLHQPWAVLFMYICLQIFSRGTDRRKKLETNSPRPPVSAGILEIYNQFIFAFWGGFVEFVRSDSWLLICLSSVDKLTYLLDF